MPSPAWNHGELFLGSVDCGKLSTPQSVSFQGGLEKGGS